MGMTVQWPDNSKSRFGRDILQATHTLNTGAAFSDAWLVDILDRYPREQLGIWTFGEHGDGEAAAIRGAAPHATGAEILDAVKRGTIWLNLREANCELPDLQPIADDIFGSLECASQRTLRKKDMGLLISSPNVHVHYHLDIPLVALFQLRGRKRIWLYPADETHAPSNAVEDMVHMLKEEGLPFESAFDHNAVMIDLEPGMGLTWPQTAPHRVQNEDCINVSLSCEYMTMGALVNANAIYTNGLLRKHIKFAQQRSPTVTPASFVKAAIARAMKLVARQGPRRSPTPVSFHLDLTAENCIKSL